MFKAGNSQTALARGATASSCARASKATTCLEFRMELDGNKQLKAIHHIKRQRDADNEGLTTTTAVRPFCITGAHGVTEVAHRTKVLPTVRSQY